MSVSTAPSVVSVRVGAVLGEEPEEARTAFTGHPAPENLLLSHGVRVPLKRLVKCANLLSLGVEAA